MVIHVHVCDNSLSSLSTEKYDIDFDAIQNTHLCFGP